MTDYPQHKLLVAVERFLTALGNGASYKEVTSGMTEEQLKEEFGKLTAAAMEYSEHHDIEDTPLHLLDGSSMYD